MAKLVNRASAGILCNGACMVMLGKVVGCCVEISAFLLYEAVDNSIAAARRSNGFISLASLVI